MAHLRRKKALRGARTHLLTVRMNDAEWRELELLCRELRQSAAGMVRGLLKARYDEVVLAEDRLLKR